MIIWYAKQDKTKTTEKNLCVENYTAERTSATPIGSHNPLGHRRKYKYNKPTNNLFYLLASVTN